MLLLQHSLLSLLSRDGNIEKFKEYIPYIMFPDAIRFYPSLEGHREYSHFEGSDINDEVSYLVYPSNIKTLTDYKLSLQPKFYAEHSSCCLGQKTNIEMFVKTNSYLLNTKIGMGIYEHLYPDDTFDFLIREMVDVSNRKNDKYIFKKDNLIDLNHKSYNGKEIRELILTFEKIGILILMEKLKKYKINITQEWVDVNIKQPLKDCYSEELYLNTCKYLDIDLDFPISPFNIEKCYEIYDKIYNDCIDFYKLNFRKGGDISG